MEHSAHRGRRHPVEVTEVGAPRGCLDLETTKVPLLRIYDGGPLGQGAQGHPAGDLPSNRREGRGRRGEHRADECVAPIPESSLHQLEEFGAGVDGDPGVFGDLPWVDRPRSDGSVKGLLALGISESRENPEDAGASDLRDEPDVRGPTRRHRNEPTAGAIEVGEQRHARLRHPVDPAAGLRLGIQAFDEAPPSHLAKGSAHMGDAEGRFAGDILRELRFARQGVQDAFPIAARRDETEIRPDSTARLHHGPLQGSASI